MKKRYLLPWYLSGALTARTGDEMSGPALLLAAYALTGSAAEASALLAAATVAAAAGGPVLGALLDRAERPGRLLAAALAAHAAGLLAVLLALDRLPFPVTLLIAVLTGLPGPALSAGWTARLPTPTPRAAALDAMTFHAASLAGPALAALAARLLGAPAAVAGAAALMWVAAGVALRLPGRGGVATVARGGVGGAGGRRVGGSLGVRLVAGTRYVLAHRTLAAVTLGSVVSCAGQGVLTACVPLLGERVLGSAAAGALLLSLSAASALVANAVHARWASALDPVRVMCGGALLQAGGALLAALAMATVTAAATVTATSAVTATAAGGRPAAAGVVALVVAAAVLSGVGEGPQLAALFAVRHRESPERLRGQIFATGASAKITGFALGAAAGGLLGSWSPAGALTVAAGLQLVAARVTLGRR
ncbi:MFS transporter [Streptomyces sp. NPDC002328]|uniref:MFS transporter n=1 Tax=Streptomyces sp. NPDC002328 TaxID=3364642 RepID=UPI0036B73EDF